MNIAKPDPARDVAVRALWRTRPRSRFVRLSMLAALGLLVLGWTQLEGHISDFRDASTLHHAQRILDREITPRPVRDTGWDWAVVLDWAGGLMQERGWEAVGTTLAISVLAILLAWIWSLVLCLPAAQNFATPSPFLRAGRDPSGVERLAWRCAYSGTRAALILMRSLPEYVLAFLLLAVVGHSAWPAVLALAIHNAGILGRLNAEVIENLPARTLAALRGLGAHRSQVAAFGVFPAALPRFLLYFFYRWETCVREATVLGMLGIGGLGYWILEADAHDREDKLVFYVLLGSAIVILGDLLSALARRIVRRA
jgi:phosphonate transport system permease protein